MSSTGTVRTVSSYNNSYMFTGREYDTETGLYYYRARYYDPGLGRFLETDPLGYVDSENLYAYVGNNPWNWVDPKGEFIFEYIIPVLVTAAFGYLFGGEVYDAYTGQECPVVTSPGTVQIGPVTVHTGNNEQPFEGEGEQQKTCPPCTPYPAGTVGYMGPHYDDHFPCGNPHMNLFKVHQDPKTCKCYWRRNKPDCASGATPDPGWVNLNDGFPVLSP